MKKRSSSFGVALIELIVAVAIFSVVSAQCVQIFVSATQLSNSSANLSRAVILAEGAAESFRATADCAETAGILGGSASDGGFTVYYDDYSATDEANAKFILTGTAQDENGLAVCRIAVSLIDGGEVFTVRVAGGEVSG